MACISVGSIFDTSTKQQLVREILSPNGDWESFLKNAVSEKTDVLIEKINKVIQAYGGREELIRLDEDFSLDVNAFRDAIFYEIESNGANMRRSETQLVEKPDINIAFEPWDAGGKSRLTKAFNHKLTSSIIINTKVVNGKPIFFSPVYGDEDQKNEQISKILFNYKMQLIQTINALIGGQLDANPTMTDTALTQIIEDALTRFENYKNGLTEEQKAIQREAFYREQQYGKTTQYIDANDAYIKLKYFNYLIQDCGFVDIKNAYKNTDIHGVSMYKFKTPKMNHVTRWGSEEIKAIDKHASSAFKLITNNIPCVDSAGNVIENQYVGEDGFRSIMSQFKLWLRSSNNGQNTNYDASLENGDINGLRAIFEKFVTQNFSESAEIADEYKVKYPDRLRGLSVFFNSQMDEYVPLMWSYVLRTESINYNLYSVKNNALQKTSARYRVTRLQSYKLLDTIKGTIYNNQYIFKNYKNNDGLKNRYGITMDGDDIIMFTGTDHEIKLVRNTKGRENSWVIEYIDPRTVGSDKKEYIGYEEGLVVNTDSGSILIKPNIGATNDAIRSFIEETIGVIPSNWSDFTKVTSLANLYTPAIGTIITALESPDSFEYDEYLNGDIKILNPYKSGLVNAMVPLVDFITAAKGLDLVVTLKDLNGNSIPAFGMTSFQYNLESHKNKMQREAKTTGKINALANNFVFQNSHNVGQEIIRNTVEINGDVKASKQLSSNEVTYLAITSEFGSSLYDENNKYVELQNTTNSDKVTHPIIPYGKSISLDSDFTLGAALMAIVQDGSDAKKATRSILKKLYDCRVSEYRAVAKSFINDYNKVLKVNFSTDDADLLHSINSLYSILKNTTIDTKSMQALFKENGVDFEDQLHSAGGEVNETLFAEMRMYCGGTFDEFAFEMRKNLFNFARDLHDSRIVFNIKNREVADLVKKLPNSGEGWVDTDTGEMLLFKEDIFGNILEINPILIAYNYGDALCSSEYNKATFGMTFFHPCKMSPKETDMIDYIIGGFPVMTNNTGKVLKINDQGEYIDPDTGDLISQKDLDENYYIMQVPSKEYLTAESSARLNASFKRTVIGGATLIPYLPQKYGVGTECVYAAVKDLNGTVWNMMGVESAKEKSMDGSMLVSPIFSKMAQISCTDAAVGYDSKTILGDISASYGKPTLFKSAEYALTNNRRQLGYMSDASVEALYEKMHSLPLTKTIKLEDYYNYTLFNKSGQDKPIYMRNPATGKHYKISDFSTNFITVDGKQVAQLNYKLTEVSKFGTKVQGQNAYNVSRIIENLYDIDQVFGGAYSEKFDEESGTLVDGENNLNYLTKIVCEEDLKLNFVSYLVNTSAEKVGACNINDASLFNRNFGRKDNGKFDSNKIWVRKISTMGLGVQMDPNHELDFSEVTEMSQMISALIQGGYSTKLVNQIYTEIGKIVDQSLRKVNKALETNDDDEVYRILGESLMKSFETSTKSTIGLAQSFVMRARISLNNGNKQYKIPFSAPTINSAFISDVISRLNSSGIRRKYAGIAAVLVPSNNMFQYYSINGEKQLFNEFIVDFTKNFISSEELVNLNPIEQEIYIKQKFEQYSDENIIKSDPNLVSISSDGTVSVNNKTLQKINTWDAEIEDTVVLVNKLDLTKREVVKIDSYENLNKVRNKINNNDYYCFNWTIKPKNLRQADIRFTTPDGKIRSIYDLDSVRASHCIAHIKDGGTLADLNDKNDAYIVQRVLSQIINSMTWDQRNYYDLLDRSTIGFKEELDKSQLKLFKKLIDDETNRQLMNIDKTGQITYQYGWQSEEIHLTNENNIWIDEEGAYVGKVEETIAINNIQSRFAEMMMGRLHAKELGLMPGDSISQIRKEKDTFFYRRLVSKLSIESLGTKGSAKQEMYDYALLTKSGNVIYISLKNLHKDEISKYNLDNKICTMDNNGVWINNETKLCDPIEGAKIKTVRDVKGRSCPLLIVNSIDDLTDLFNSDNVSIVKENVNKNNVQILLAKRFPKINDGKSIILEGFDEDFTITKKMLNNFDSLDNVTKQKIIDYANDQFITDIESKYMKLAREQYDAFEQQLLYIGARIPTQSMQSFQALECIAFTEDETGKVYVPKVQTWLQGSDYDIDKLYIMSFALNDDGTLPTFSNLMHKYVVKNPTEILALNSPNGVRYTEHISGLPSGVGKRNNLLGKIPCAQLTGNSWMLPFVSITLNKETGSFTISSLNEENKVKALEEVSAFFDEYGVQDKSRLKIEYINVDPNLANNFDVRLKSRNSKIPFITQTDIENAANQTSLDKFNDIMESEGSTVKFADDVSEENRQAYLEMLNIHTRGEYQFYLSDHADVTINKADAIAILNDDKKVINKYLRQSERSTYIISGIDYDTVDVLNKLNEAAKVKSLRINNVEKALQNSNTARMLKLLKQANVQPFGHDPISLDELGDIAKEHTSTIEKRTTMDNAYVKFMMQFQNMVGKGVVGIAAVGMKVFFAVSDYVNTEINNAVNSFSNYDDVALATHLTNILFADTSTGSPKIATLANINLEPLIELLRNGNVYIDISTVWDNLSEDLQTALSPFMSGNSIDLNELLNSDDGLINQSSKTNAAMNISQFLSAATDNAKELILSKINGGIEFADMWTYLMMTGHTLQECAKIMTSPFFQCVSTLSQANDIDEISRSVKSKEIMKFVAMEGEIHTINNGLLAFLRRGPIEGSANNCFLLKLLFKTDDRGRFIDSSGNIIKFEGKNDLETLNAKGVKLKYPIQFKVITPNGLEDRTITSEYIQNLIGNINLMKEESKFWLTSTTACDIFIKHIKSQLPERTIADLFKHYDQYDMDEAYDDAFGDESNNLFVDEQEDDDAYDLAEDENGEYSETTEQTIDFSNREDDMRKIISYIARYAKPRAELFEYMTKDDYKVVKSVVRDIALAVEEQSIMGALLSINQGMKTNLYEFYSKLMRLENFINRRYKESKVEETFDVEQFLSDPGYAKKHSDIYNKIKKYVNPLGAILAIPNFKKMFFVQNNALKLIERSVQTKLDWNISRQLIANEDGSIDRSQKLSKPLFDALHNGIRDSLIMSWLTTLNKQINIPEGAYIYLHNDRKDISKYMVPKGTTVPIVLNSIETFATFKNMMHKIVFPAIKNIYPDNAFARSLQSVLKIDNLTKTPVSSERLSLDISSADSSVEATAEYNAIQGDFMKIYNDKSLAQKLGIGDISIGDLVYLYNLIVYKDGFGQDSLTRLFERTNVYNVDSLVNQYYTYLSEVDESARNATLKYDETSNEYRLYNKYGKSLPVIIKKNDILTRLAVIPDAKNILKIQAMFNEDGSYEGIEFLDKYGASDPEKEPLNVHNANPDDFVMNLPFSTDGITLKSKTGLNEKVNLSQYVTPSSRTTMTSLYNAIFDMCNLNGINVWSGTSKELVEKLKEDNIPIEDDRELGRILAAKGFIANGKIYLNESVIYDSNDPVLFHELSHAICATMKFGKSNTVARGMYYKMVNSTFDRMMKEVGLQGLVKIADNLGFKNPEKAIYLSDFKEELFVNEISRALKHGVDETIFVDGGIDISEEQLTNLIKEKIGDILHLDDYSELNRFKLEETGNTSPEDCLAVMGRYLSPGRPDAAFTVNVEMSQKTKGLKLALLNSKDPSFDIDINCK